MGGEPAKSTPGAVTVVSVTFAPASKEFDILGWPFVTRIALDPADLEPWTVKVIFREKRARYSAYPDAACSRGMLNLKVVAWYWKFSGQGKEGVRSAACKILQSETFIMEADEVRN